MSGLPTHPSLEMPDRMSGSQLKAHCDAMRRYHNTMFDAFLGYAHDLERGLRNAEGGSWWKMGLDVKLAARRTVRPIMKAAEMHRDIARSWMRVSHLFAELFQGNSAGRHNRGPSVDVNR